MITLYMSFIDDEDEREKFEIIYRLYRKRMVSTAYSVLHNREDAEDTVHEIFIRIAKNMKSIDNPMSERTLSYVIKATKNNAINLLNKNNKEKDNIDIESIENIPDKDFFEKLSVAESYDEIVSAIQALSEVYRDVMYFHYVLDMKIKDVADLFGEKTSTVQQKLIRGKKKILEILSEKSRD